MNLDALNKQLILTYVAVFQLSFRENGQRQNNEVSQKIEKCSRKFLPQIFKVTWKSNY